MRILLHGNYEGQVFVLRKENGDIYRQIAPHTVFNIGSICSYFAKRIWWGNSPTIALVRLSSGMASLKPQELKRKTRIQKGFILKPGKGLWAMTAGSAHNGVWHLLKETSNPVLIALWSHEMPAKLLEKVGEIDCQVFAGGNLCEHSRAGSYNYHYSTDGNIGELRKATHIKHSGRFCQSKEAVIQVIGGTYCVQSVSRKENNGKIYPRILSVRISAQADLGVVSKVINQMMK